jgi:crotonobetainyl-CoA:carnitine CoA-transferase CaiB-like acyl-CoA transferase
MLRRVTPGSLDGVRVLDLSRILAGPSATQLLGDLGADVVKVERPGAGDDTRGWGPPYARAADGTQGPSTYFLSANRNKRSIAIDLSTDAGAALIRRLAASSDVLVENYKVGDLARRGLDYASLRSACPRLVYCSITGFGQTGPRAAQVGYDFVAQAMGGIMSLTGDPEGEPVKVGVGIADLMCGMYASVAILAALRHRDRTGAGQHIDLSLFDTQLAWLANEGVSHLVTGAAPKRRGNAHPTIVPYRVFATSDGFVVLAIGNDGQFRRFCEAAETTLGGDARFATNDGRVRDREACEAAVAELMAAHSTSTWIERLARADVPCSPVNTVGEAFADPQAVARGMRVEIASARFEGGSVPLIGSPIRMSETPVTYRRAPPEIGADARDVLSSYGLTEDEIASALRDAVR